MLGCSSESLSQLSVAVVLSGGSSSCQSVRPPSSSLSERARSASSIRCSPRRYVPTRSSASMSDDGAIADSDGAAAAADASRFSNSSMESSREPSSGDKSPPPPPPSSLTFEVSRYAMELRRGAPPAMTSSSDLSAAASSRGARSE